MAARRTNGSSSKTQISAHACPICGKPVQQEFRPFCSRRCANVDLHRWFSGQYAIPATEDDDEDGARHERGTASDEVDGEPDDR